MKTFTPLKEVKPKIITRNLLPNSELLVKEGDLVTPSDILGETKPSAGFHIANIATALDTPGKNARQYILRKEGERIYKGEILAERPKMFSKETLKAYARIDGIIQHINELNGQVLLKMLRKQEYIPAGVWGKVLKIGKNNEIQIETQVLEVNGKVGRGFERGGSIKIVGNPHETIHENLIKEEHSGKILVGGSMITREAIGKCVSVGIVGCVTGGLEYNDVLAINPNSDIGVSLIVLEGYGTMSINDNTYETLKKCDNFYSFINGKESKLIIPMETISPEKIDLTGAIYEVGTPVRITFDYMIGQSGKIKELIPEYSYPSGLKGKAVRVSTRNTEYIVPEKNIEILT